MAQGMIAEFSYNSSRTSLTARQPLACQAVHIAESKSLVGRDMTCRPQFSAASGLPERLLGRQFKPTSKRYQQ